MRFFSLFAPSSQARIAPAIQNKDLGGIGSLPFRIAAYSAAILLIICAASQNVAYGWQLGASRSEFAGYILASGALAAAVMAPICLVVAFSERGFWLRIAAAFLGLWCLAYGVTASLGFVSTGREALNSERAAVIEVRHQAKARHDAAAAELAQISTGKSTQWRAARARELQTVMADATGATQRQAAVTLTDPQSAAIAIYLSAAGFAPTTEMVSMWTTAFTTAFFEVAGAFALVVARAAGLHSTTQPKAAGESLHRDLPTPTHAPAQPSNRAVRTQGGIPARDADDRDDPPPPKGKPGRRPNVLPAQAIERLRKQGGRAQGSLTGIGRLLGSKSKTTTHRLLHQLSASGMIRLASGPSGVNVALA